MLCVYTKIVADETLNNFSFIEFIKICLFFPVKIWLHP